MTTVQSHFGIHMTLIVEESVLLMQAAEYMGDRQAIVGLSRVASSQVFADYVKYSSKAIAGPPLALVKVSFPMGLHWGHLSVFNAPRMFVLALVSLWAAGDQYRCY